VSKPRGLGAEYAGQFRDEAVVAAYACRPPYPPATFDVLGELVRESDAVLDLGCGTGDLACGLAGRVARVDAVDWSEAMLRVAREREPAVNWIHAPVETAPLEPPYGLVTAGESLHWFDWDVVFGRLAGLGAPLAIVFRVEEAESWTPALREIIPRYSTNVEFEAYDLLGELERGGYFTPAHMHRTGSVAVKQGVEAYIESIHSRNGFSRDRMTPEAADAFDEEVRTILPTDSVEIHTHAHITWG